MRNLSKMPVTLCTMTLCIIITILINLHPDNIVDYSIFFGGYYRAFVLAGEWYRLLTVGFVHYSIVHLFVNMMSLFTLGSFLEPSLKMSQYSLVLFGSVIGGSLLTVCLPGNSVAVGLSGGLYGLMACEIWLLYKLGFLNNPYIRRQIISTLLVNLCINFLPGISYTAHIGGFISGLLITILISKPSPKQKTLATIFLSLFILSTTTLTYLNRHITNGDDMYLGTDIKVLNLYTSAGFDKHAEKMKQNLVHVYEIEDYNIFNNLK